MDDFQSCVSRQRGGRTEYDQRCVYATFSTKSFKSHNFRCVCPPLDWRQPGLKLVPGGVLSYHPSVITLWAAIYRPLGLHFKVQTVLIFPARVIYSESTLILLLHCAEIQMRLHCAEKKYAPGYTDCLCKRVYTSKQGNKSTPPPFFFRVPDSGILESTKKVKKKHVLFHFISDLKKTNPLLVRM